MTRISQHYNLHLYALGLMILLSSCFCNCPDAAFQQSSKETITFRLTNASEGNILTMRSKQLECGVDEVVEDDCDCIALHICSRSYRVDGENMHPLDFSETQQSNSRESHTDVYFYHAHFYLNHWEQQESTDTAPWGDTTMVYYPMQNLSISSADNPIDSVYYSPIGIFKIVYKNGTIWWRNPN